MDPALGGHSVDYMSAVMVEALKAAMGSNKASESSKAYAKSKASLNAYLDEVELPDLSDVRYANPAAACFFKCEETPP